MVYRLSCQTARFLTALPTERPRHRSRFGQQAPKFFDSERVRSSIPNLILILSFLISAPLAMIAHELGHLAAARRYGVRVSELGLGLGPKLFGFRLGALTFSLRAIPLASFLRLDGTALESRPAHQQLVVHLGGIISNLILGFLTYGTVFGWVNLLLAVSNLFPLYKHDGWKCGVVLMRALIGRKSPPVEWAFTFSGGFASLALAVALFRFFV
jgi:membrane-associated protease RseP (regulator of RpoE activity)